MKKLRGVCIGTGYFSHFQYEAWNRLDGVEIVAVCGTSIAKAQAICDQYKFEKAYDNLEVMLQTEKPDFIDIITPPNTHLPFCQLAIKHNVHIICQKPLAPTYEESQQIAKSGAESNIRIMVHENFRFQPWHTELKKLLNQKVIGNKLHTINLRMRMGDGWQEDAYMNRQPYFREMERLLIYETGIHFIDVFRYLIGEVTQVNARLKTLNSNIKGEDFAWVTFDFENGALGFIDASRYHESTAKNARLTFGYWQIDADGGSLRLYEDGKITIQKLGKPEQTHLYTFNDIGFAGDCVFATQKHFIECLQSNQPFMTDVSIYLKNIGIQEAIYESNEKKITINTNSKLVKDFNK
ncbi:Gfo/Idh/MocA family oxidoreductase [Aurantibacter crassamenti]|uniref:Gfo/Idh/MocA family protein n=1 Tax=Aurantibacter crassamenti TaxID=1837375 RepID=UPI0019397CB0|nr:Gfo/Idh/MocA family oxidoreductase [Aurantibacter crassamenti]MBM1105878.1 Gfo/Idh/MocA family oxidoreductase [Aurantibacter crassamenti]